MAAWSSSQPGCGGMSKSPATPAPAPLQYQQLCQLPEKGSRRQAAAIAAAAAAAAAEPGELGASSFIAPAAREPSCMQPPSCMGKPAAAASAAARAAAAAPLAAEAAAAAAARPFLGPLRADPAVLLLRRRSSLGARPRDFPAGSRSRLCRPRRQGLLAVVQPGHGRRRGQHDGAPQPHLLLRGAHRLQTDPAPRPVRGRCGRSGSGRGERRGSGVVCRLRRAHRVPQLLLPQARARLGPGVELQRAVPCGSDRGADAHVEDVDAEVVREVRGLLVGLVAEPGEPRCGRRGSALGQEVRFGAAGLAPAGSAAGGLIHSGGLIAAGEGKADAPAPESSAPHPSGPRRPHLYLLVLVLLVLLLAAKLQVVV